jgi:hypothetical protein
VDPCLFVKGELILILTCMTALLFALHINQSTTS